MNRGDSIAQVVGWVKWHTTRGVARDSKIRRSAWAQDDKGKWLTIKHAALDLNWKPQTAINYFYAAESEGLIRIEKDAKKNPGRIGLCADIPKSRRTKGELNNFVQSRFPAQLIEQIEKLSEVNRKLFESAYQQYQKWCKDIFDDGAGQVRDFQAQAEDTILHAFCLERKRCEKRRVKKTPVRVELPEVPDFVHFVQSEVCTESESGIVQRQNEPHIKEAETELKAAAQTHPRKAAAAASKAPDTEAQELAEALKEADPIITPATARRLLDACRQKAPGCNPPVSVQEVLDACAGLIERKGGITGRAWREIRNPTGLFMSTIPQNFPEILEQLRRRIA
jgi:hypothetical protein